MSSAPAPPDPYQTSAAQTQSNQQTAAYNAALNRVNTNTPYGSLKYTTNGTDASGAPIYQADVNLTPATQHQLETQQAQDSAIGDLGLGLTQQIGGQINSPMPDAATSGQAASDAYYGKQTAYLDPQWQNNQHDLEASLANKGVMEGSEAWNRAQGDLGRQKEFAYGQARDQSVLQGQQTQAQALANAITQKNQPINQLSALRSGTQIQNPNFPSVPGSNSAGTDVAGNINANYQQQLANVNNFNSGLFGLGSAGIAAISDRRLKTAIERIGESPVMKLPLYAFRYIWGGPERVGVMAQDVLKVKPEAVVTMPNGYMAVHYGMLS